MQSKLSSLPVHKRVALVAHDNMKSTLTEWVLKHKAKLSKHHLYATGTTGFNLERECQLPISKFISGPLGGDQQIGSKICEGQIDTLIFFWDPFEPMPHDPDVKALLRLATAWNIPIANNIASADFIIQSPLFDQAYARPIPDYDHYIAERTK